MFHAERQTDGHDEANNRFSQFCERAIKICIVFCEYQLQIKHERTTFRMCIKQRQYSSFAKKKSIFKLFEIIQNLYKNSY